MTTLAPTPLRGRFETREAIQKTGTEFYRRGIFKLPERWKKCVQRSGDYVEKKKKRKVLYLVRH
jgi:hypothetical protein